MTAVAGTQPITDAPPKTAPTFLVGSVRSGTTLLRLMLDHHPELAFHFEFEHAVDRVSDDGRMPPIADYHAYLRQDRIFNLSGLQIDESLDYRQLVDSLLHQHRQRDGKRFAGATVHHGFEKLRYLWPNAKYVHLVRDGRDVARSCIAMGWAGNMYCGVNRWIEAELAWERLAPRLRPEQKLELRYEDLVRESDQVLAEVCEFIGVEFDPAMYDYAKTSTYELPDAKLLSQWKRKLSEQEVQLAEARIADMMVERGYELSGFPAIEVGPAEANRLRWHDWWSRAKFRRNRYGTTLFATDFLARRLGIGPLAHACKRRTDAIDNEHIR
ncbi:MAG: sulfotransferase [Planctomycetota bacterium]